MTLIFYLCLLALAIVAYIRIAPHDVAKWHIAPDVTQDETLLGGAKRLVNGDQQTLRDLDQIIREEPRTVVLAGSIEEGMITYITRTRMIGFPDYTTVQATDDGFQIYSRLRFGRSDLGVNAARVDRWIKALQRR